MNQSTFQAIGEAAQNIGSEDFNLVLLDILKSIEPVQKTVVARYSQHAPSDITYTEGTPLDTVELFRREFYDLDPFYAWWRSSGKPGVISLTDAMSTIEDDSYAKVYLKHAEISDEIGIFLPIVGGETTALFVERSTGQFSASVLENFRAVFPALSGLFLAHVGRVYEQIEGRHAVAKPTVFVDTEGQPTWIGSVWTKLDYELVEPFIHTIRRPGSYFIDEERVLVAENVAPDFPIAPRGLMLVLTDRGRIPISGPAGPLDNISLSPDLTKREQDVVALILTGYSSKEIAEKLSISHGTVKNYRLRIYQKLGVSSERELFVLRFRAQRA